MPEIYENYIAHPVIADVNKDGCGDVIAAGLYGGLYIFDGKEGKILWKQQNSGNLDQAIISTPLVADVGGDKKLDIFVRRADNKFYNIATNAKVPKNTLLWNQVNNNALNTGSSQYAGFKASGHFISIVISLLFIIGLVLINIFLIRRRKAYFATT